MNLNGTEWPVLRYWDRHDFAGASWGRIEISTDNNSWTIVGGVTETRNTWQKQEIDLSPWRNQVRVFVRFRSGTDGNLADGWTIDDLSLEDRGAGTVGSFFDSFEDGTAQWLANAWTPVVGTPYAGSFSLHDTPGRRNPPDTPNHLVLANELDLTDAVEPSLTYFIRGTLPTNSYFRVQISTNGGLAWSDITALNRNPGFNSATWIREQAPLTPWIGQVIRLRFVSSSDWRQPQSDIFLDNIGVGEPTPGAPVPLSPLENETATIVRPTLVVGNAIDYQSDGLAYQFEVYAGATLAQFVAQVPSVASGVSTTSWQVDVDLPDNAPYWWRARASDGTHTGPWSEVVPFNLNEFNNPPHPVLVAGPANDSLMLDGNGLLLWFQTSDPDPGDLIRDYHIQISSDAAFSTIAVDAPGIVVAPEVAGPGQLAAYFLGDLPGGAELPSGRWFWRIRARDVRFSNGLWSDGFAYFRLPTFYQRYLRQIYPDPDWFLYDVSDPSTDPDGNGVGVLMEFAIGIAPGEDPGDRLPAPVSVLFDGRPHQGFEWTSRKLHELNYRLESSTNLRNWTTVSGTHIEVLHDVDATSERVRLVDPLPVGTWQQRFIRLAIDD